MTALKVTHTDDDRRYPWPDKYIEQRRASAVNVSDMRRVLQDAKDEAPLQTFLGATPVLLRALMRGGIDAWCFDRPSFGGELIPDFLLASRFSSGLHWVYIELESPTAAPLNKAGRPSGKLVTALSQINDWRIWLRENIAYARTHLGYQSIDAECHATIVIGRRSTIKAEHALKYRELSRQNVAVMTYDRLIEISTSSSWGGGEL